MRSYVSAHLCGLKACSMSTAFMSSSHRTRRMAKRRTAFAASFADAPLTPSDSHASERACHIAALCSAYC